MQLHGRHAEEEVEGESDGGDGTLGSEAVDLPDTKNVTHDHQSLQSSRLPCIGFFVGGG